MPNSTLLVLLGNQLFDIQQLPPPSKVIVFMREDMGLCTYVRRHQQKIVLFLAAMRAYADELRDAGYVVSYSMLDTESKLSYEDDLHDAVEKHQATELVHFEIEDKVMESRIESFAAERQLSRRVLTSPMFLCTRSTFADFARSRDRLLMADFYKQQRLRLGILLDSGSKPLGGKWSFDAENRRKLPASVTPPAIPAAARTAHAETVIRLVRRTFADHPGNAEEFWWPTTRTGALTWLDDFLQSRLELFGPYEDAVSQRSDTVFHSALSPLLNIGLITPTDVIDRTVAFATDRQIPIQSLEGFVRQVIGWREFVRGVYRERGPWCEVVDGLYWRFISRHRDFFASNPRLALMPKALDKLNADRKDRIFAAAEHFLERHTSVGDDD